MKYCTNCGEELNDNASYCPKCGSKQESINVNVSNDLKNLLLVMEKMSLIAQE